MPCDQRIACPCPGLPLSNYSSEDPDRLVYLGRWFGRQVPPPMNIVDNDDCVTFAGSTQSSEDADNCAQAANNECEVVQATDSPCDICQAPASGSPGLTLNLGFGFVSTDQSSSSDPCCDPDLPAECCCSTAPQDPDPDPPPPGGPDNPGQPGQPPVNPPRMFGNTPQTCSVTCPDGTEWSATVPSGRVQAISQALADSIAHSMACEEANQRKECHEGSNTCGCETFCLDSPGNYQVGNVPVEGEEKAYEVVGGELPAGMVLTDSGQITGTPTDTSESSTVSVKVTDSQGRSSVVIICVSVLGITTETLPDGAVGSGYGPVQLQASGGHPPYSWSVESNMPDGLSINPTTGVISGTPTVADTFMPTFRIEDSCGAGCLSAIEIFIDGVANEAQTVNVPCVSDASKNVSVTIPARTVFYPPGTTQFDANAAARLLAFNQASAQLQASGCGCFVKNLDTSGSYHAGIIYSSALPPCNPGLYGVDKNLLTTIIPPLQFVGFLGSPNSAPGTNNLDAEWDAAGGAHGPYGPVGFIPNGKPAIAANVLFWWTHIAH